MNTLYNTLVLPYLNYCNTVWAKNHPTLLKPLLLLQKSCMRIITHIALIEPMPSLFFQS